MLTRHQALARAASAVPPGWLHALGGRPLLLPYYHMVTDEAAPHVRPLYRFRTVAEFVRDLEWLLRHYRAISLDDLLGAVAGRAHLPARSFLLSFDDGFREMHDVVMPILRARGVPAVFFVTSACVDNATLCHHQVLALVVSQYEADRAAFPANEVSRLLDAEGVPAGGLTERLLGIGYANRHVAAAVAERCGCDTADFLRTARPYLDSEQVRALLKNGFAVGAHSVDHPLYAELAIEEQIRQTRVSARFVRERFNVAEVAFAFPHSDTGVSLEFFRRLYEDGSVALSFGTGGMLRDAVPRHFQRFGMEKTALPGRATVAYHYARRVGRSLVGRGRVTHGG